MADKDFVVKNGLVVNNNLLVANGDSNRIGINTLTPDVTLTVNGSANVSGNLKIGGDFTVSGNIISVGTFQATGNVVPDANGYYMGSSDYRWLFFGIDANISNTLIVANVTVNNVVTVGNTVVNTTNIRVGNSSVYSLMNKDSVQTTGNVVAVNAYLTYVNTASLNAVANLTVGSSSNGVSIVNTTITVGNSSVNATVNSTVFTGSANNTTYLNGQPASYYTNAANLTDTVNAARLTGSYANITAVGNLTGLIVTGNTSLNVLTVSANANFDTGTLFVDATNNRVAVNNTAPAVTLQVNSNDAILVPIGNTGQRPTGANGYIRYNSELASFEGYANGLWSIIGGTSGGYYKGNQGTIGQAVNKDNLYRINSNTQSSNVTVDAGENAMTAGPLVIQDGSNLTISEGGRVVIV